MSTLAGSAGMPDQNRTSVVGIVASAAIGALVMLAGSDGSSKVGSITVFAVCGLLAYVINWVVLVPSSLAKAGQYFDLTTSRLSPLLCSSAPNSKHVR